MAELNHNPDVLTCLANLSNDEVFTSPDLVNSILDMLPLDLWSSPETKILDPSTKSGVFLREIAKRFINGLKNEIPNLQERIDHIMKKQLFGYAITELTSYLSRRSLYCSKTANGPYSVSQFKSNEGNIFYKRVEHKWSNDRCIFCGASKKSFNNGPDFETHAYEFIHMDQKKIKELIDMKFDLIITNPPYQLSDGGAQASAIPIYQKFIEMAKKLNPRFISMIIPSRWMTGGKGLDQFRDEMISDKRICELHDFPNAQDCFTGVEIKGGVCYFLWNRDYSGECSIFTHNGNKVEYSKRFLREKGCNFFIRNNNLVSIFHRVKNENSFVELVSAMKPFGLRGDFFNNPDKYNLPPVRDKKINGDIAIYGLDSHLKRSIRYVDKNYPLPDKTYLPKYKLFISRNQGSGQFGESFSTPILSGPNTCCTETFVVIGLFENKEAAFFCYKYICTKFFRALVGIKKNDQGASRGVYEFVPLQDFTNSSDIDWTKTITEIDQQLYRKYKLTNDEVAFVESSVKPMYLEKIDEQF